MHRGALLHTFGLGYLLYMRFRMRCHLKTAAGLPRFGDRPTTRMECPGAPDGQ